MRDDDRPGFVEVYNDGLSAVVMALFQGICGVFMLIFYVIVFAVALPLKLLEGTQQKGGSNLIERDDD